MLPEWKGGRSYGRETLSEMRGCAGDAGFACGWNHSGEKKWGVVGETGQRYLQVSDTGL
jgi:hypothetical protein